MITVATLFASLEGKWHFQRVISNHGTIQGIACFQKGNSRELLQYKEEGVFTTYCGKTWNVYRSFLYVLENETISVYMSDGTRSLLHTLTPTCFADPEIIVNATTHVCGNDHYQARYAFHLPNQFSLQYTVTGPQKNYEMSTIFTRRAE